MVKKPTLHKIGKTPMVLVPLALWHELEELIEDKEMEQSETLQKRVLLSRRSKKLYSLQEVKEKLGL